MSDWVDKHLQEVIKYQKLLDEIPEDCKIERIEMLSKMLVFIGKLSAEFSEQYKKVYAARKQVHAEAYINATKNKSAKAELAIVHLREMEAEAYGNYKRWGNAFDSTKEAINALKYKVRIDIEDGSSKG
jgi:hypothetical protein